MTLELRAVSKLVDGQVHIHPTNITLTPGDFYILLGATLAGKTSLMHLMTGLVQPSAGHIYVDGHDVTRVPVQIRNVAMVYQQFMNYPHMTVFDNIASPLRITRTPAQDIRRRVHEMAELLGLTAFLDRKPAFLSGGQQQRTAMARALVKDAKLVLMDEPLANLDFKLREELRDELPRLFMNRDCVVVYATSEAHEALLLRGRTAVLHEGRVIEFGNTHDLYHNPLSRLTAQAFSNPPINIASITKTGNKIILGPDQSWIAPAWLANQPNGAYDIGIRPYHISPIKSCADDLAIPAQITVVEISGNESTIHFQSDGLSWISLFHGIYMAKPGTQEVFYLNLDHVFYFDQQSQRISA